MNGESVLNVNVPLELSCAVDRAPTYSVLPAELEVVAAAAAGDVPRHRVVDLIGVVYARLRHGVLLIDERQVVELRIERGLILAVGVEVGVRERDVFLSEVDAQRVEAVATEHRIERRDQCLIDVVLLARRVGRHWQRHGYGDREHDRDDLIELRRRLPQPADRPGMIDVQLMVDARQRVPHAILSHR